MVKYLDLACRRRVNAIFVIGGLLCKPVSLLAHVSITFVPDLHQLHGRVGHSFVLSDSGPGIHVIIIASFNAISLVTTGSFGSRDLPDLLSECEVLLLSSHLLLLLIALIQNVSITKSIES